MSPEERRTVLITAGILLLASLVRLGWEARPVPPLLPSDTSAYAPLIEETDRLLEEEERRRTPLASGERIDPNRDSEVELARLPGVGPALAARIVASREAEGPFRFPEEMARVPGIGDATVERLRELLDVSDPPSFIAGGPGAGPGGTLGGGGAGASGGPIDLNRADAAELETLPGIGPALASRILETRRARGRFQTLDELMEVSGVGPAVLERLRPLVVVR